jgi:hypothetical protein
MTAMSAQRASETPSIANPFSELPAIRDGDASPPSASPRDPTSRWCPRARFGDYSRTRFESRVAFAGPDEDAEEIATPTRQFSLLEITSGLPDDSREEDERASERRLRDARARVKVARAVVARTPGLACTLQRDWRRAARFYARFGISEEMLRHGVASGRVLSGPADSVWRPDPLREAKEHAQMVLPSHDAV